MRNNITVTVFFYIFTVTQIVLISSFKTFTVLIDYQGLTIPFSITINSLKLTTIRKVNDYLAIENAIF